MLTPAQFLQATGWFAIGTLVFALLTAIAFFLKWGIRFRLVGATGFMGVLTAGLLGLSFEPFTQAQIPGAVPYATVFDSGSSQVTITVPNSITATELEATLQQAASNLLKPSRIGGGGQTTPTIRARAIVHQPGISELVYVGQVTPGTSPTGERSPIVKVYPDALAKANQAAS
ncbi:Ycf51 family protein [Leptolyngbya sp. BC1307]|uniref:Ycf51 family protein n=1 Tax=Leptolyngbya sp. BC1307 TaxID=2029589 RepID=UPI000EFAF9F9|nr:Ycf51 family protein [Leptolyngbya sp. BC1307]